ncbi:gp230 [Bacillus phage W.Ph.]|uniref:Gp230 n=1 Tax=Bacillus phage W.Ph. TaxID=764595 RepID=G9B1Y1_9CAUD|nr:gp230 [Bacillus phage W.Ph.]ADH03376.1 gp230 [Bacillus phage W.Ph.]
MLRIVDEMNNEGTLIIKDEGNKLKFKIEEHNTGEEKTIKLGLKKLKKLYRSIDKYVNYDEIKRDDKDGCSYVLEKNKKFLEVELCVVNYGFVIGELTDSGRQDNWVVITVEDEEMEDILKELERKINELEGDTNEK